MERPHLVHYSSRPLGPLFPVSQVEERIPYAKPRGLWVSTEDEDGWHAWCVEEGFATDGLKYVYDVALGSSANLLWLRGSADIDAFTEEYSVRSGYLASNYMDWIDWPKVASLFQGILIAPYVWERRLDHRTHWYYGWDCASGCIWDVTAIAFVTPREGVP